MSPKVLAALDTLRAKGADRFDPLAWQHIEALAKRGLCHAPAVQSLLEHKVLQALDQLQSRMGLTPSPCDAPSQVAPTPPSALAALLHDMSHRSHRERSTHAGAHPFENPRVRQFRQQLGKISVQNQVNRAIAQAPQNAGPINSHMLVLRSLGIMRDISPDYLSRFMGYVDTLLSLEDVGKASVTSGRKSEPKSLKPAPAAAAYKR